MYACMYVYVHTRKHIDNILSTAQISSALPHSLTHSLTAEGHCEGGVQAEDDLAHEAAQVLVVGSAHEETPAVRGVLRSLLAHPEGDGAEHDGTRHLRQGRGQ
jgi:hypothetical protein